MKMVNKAWKSLKYIDGKIKSGNGDCTWKVGKWQKPIKGVDICNKGYHASKLIIDAMRYVDCEVIAEVEYKGEIVEQDDKLVAENIKIIRAWYWTKKDSMKASIYFVKQAMKYVDKKKFPDVHDACKGSIKAIEMMLNAVTDKQIEAAESAAWSAESAARSAESAAWSAAESAARSAARSAAWSAARSARSAARSARSAAWSAARSAAWSAARSAESAARSATKKLQHKWLKKYILKNCKRVDEQ
jgi:hypothetical protein